MRANVEADGGAEDDRDHEQDCPEAVDIGLERQRDGRDQRDCHSEDAEVVAELGGLVPSEPRERKHEEEGSDEEGRNGCGEDVHAGQLLENMASMRRVTANPPKMLMVASRTAPEEITVIAVSPLPI